VTVDVNYVLQIEACFLIVAVESSQPLLTYEYQFGAGLFDSGRQGLKLLLPFVVLWWAALCEAVLSGLAP